MGDHFKVLKVPEGACTGKILLGVGVHFQVLRCLKGLWYSYDSVNKDKNNEQFDLTRGMMLERIRLHEDSNNPVMKSHSQGATIIIVDFLYRRCRCSKKRGC